jgi:hypothetical protein
MNDIKQSSGNKRLAADSLVSAALKRMKAASAVSGAQEWSVSAANEVENWLVAEPVFAEDTDVYAYLADRSTKYEAVVDVAERIQCIPATAAPSERVWSTAADLDTPHRGSTTDAHFEALLMLHDNIEIARAAVQRFAGLAIASERSLAKKSASSSSSSSSSGSSA